MQTIDGERVPASERAEQTGHPSPDGRGALLVTVAATVVVAVLGWFDLGDRSLWYDEAFTVGIVDRPVGDALWRIANWELNQAPYYLLFLGWHAIATGEAFLRSLSVLCAVASVPALHLLGRRLADAWVGAVAAVLLATHAFFVEWAQQLRGYSLVVLLVIVATHLLLRAVEEETTRRVVIYAVVAAVAAYAHFFALLVIAAHATWLLLAVRPLRRRLLTVGAATGAVLVAPLAWYLLTREGDPLNWVAEPSGPLVQETVVDLVGGSDALVVLYGAAVLLGFVTVVRAAGAHRRLLLPALWLVLPVAITVVSSYTAKPLLVSRFLLVVVPALALLAAVGIRALPRRALQVAAVGALVIASGTQLADWYRASSFEEWRGATAAVLAEAEDGDPVVVSPSRAVHAVRYYQERLAGPDLELRQPDVFAAPTAEQLWEIERTPRPGVVDAELPSSYVAWRDGHFEHVEDQSFVGLRVRRYVLR